MISYCRASSQWGKDLLKREKEESHHSLLVSAGADGVVKVWASSDPRQKGSWTCCTTIDPTSFDYNKKETPETVPALPVPKQNQGFNQWAKSDFCQPVSKPAEEEEEEKPQVCAVQWIDNWKGLPTGGKEQNSFLLTSSDDFVHIWELEEVQPNDENELSFVEVMSLQFSCFHGSFGYGVSTCRVTKEASDTLQKPVLGGRDPDKMVFVFEVAYCEANGLLGVSLSDGSLRMMNARGVCISIMQFPGNQSQISAFAWDSMGTRLATCLAMGHVIVWGLQVDDGAGSLSRSCMSILERGTLFSLLVLCPPIELFDCWLMGTDPYSSGHEPGMPVFGSRFFAEDENLLLTWGVDGRLCVWDSYSQGNIHAPMATLVSNANYPIYSVALQSSCMAVGGGGGPADKPKVSATPVYLYDTTAN